MLERTGNIDCYHEALFYTLGINPDTRSHVEEAGESGLQIQRYIRLTELIQPLLDFVDEKKIGFIPGVDLSYLRKSEQEWVYQKTLEIGVFPNGSQVQLLKKYSETSELNLGMVDMVLSEEKPISKKVTLSSDKIKQFFPKEYTKQK